MLMDEPHRVLWCLHQGPQISYQVEPLQLECWVYVGKSEGGGGERVRGGGEGVRGGGGRIEGWRGRSEGWRGRSKGWRGKD